LTNTTEFFDHCAVTPNLPVVLVADDEPTMLELVARHLRSIARPKMEVIEASDGDEAWRLARDRLPDLVVLDVMMPGMSGWEVCRKIRQDAALAHTGVLMLTGIGESLNEATSPLFGADEYIDKPFDFGLLDEKIMHVLERRATQRDAVPRPSVEASDERDDSDDDDSFDDHGPVVEHGAGNGVGGHAEAAVTREGVAKRKASRSSGASKRKASRSSAGRRPKRSKPQQRSGKTEKGRQRMAAKKGAKKAKKAAKKTSKKTAKKAKKK
jgi:CheY-like chemotaxis protein